MLEKCKKCLCVNCNDQDCICVHWDLDSLADKMNCTTVRICGKQALKKLKEVELKRLKERV